MHLKTLHIVNFKNYHQAEIIFSPRINCFVGNNGVGKTNLLDAIYYLSFCKSCFNPIDSHNIRHDTDLFLIQGTYMRNDAEEVIFCGQKRNQKKQFKRNKKEYERLSDHIGLLPLVMVSPADICLITEGSEERRKFINNVISQYDKQYLHDVILYNKALDQRNALLKTFAASRKFDKDSLEIWDEKLAMLGTGIYEKRIGFIKELLPVFQYFYDFIGGTSDEVGIEYISPLHTNNMSDLLKTNLEKDRMAEYTTAGIHKDDLLLKLKNFPLKATGSQGQQKTFLVSLKLAQFEFIRRISGFKPILLLDDIFDKLDEQRVKKIVQLVAEDTFGQIFITDTSETSLESFLKEIRIDHCIIRIDDKTTISYA